MESPADNRPSGSVLWQGHFSDHSSLAQLVTTSTIHLLSGMPKWGVRGTSIVAIL